MPSLSLSLSLPEAFRLVSIHAMPKGEWIVCVCLRQEGRWEGKAYGSGQGASLDLALALAIHRAEAKLAEGPAPLPSSPSDLGL